MKNELMEAEMLFGVITLINNQPSKNPLFRKKYRKFVKSTFYRIFFVDFVGIKKKGCLIKFSFPGR